MSMGGSSWIGRDREGWYLLHGMAFTSRNGRNDIDEEDCVCNCGRWFYMAKTGYGIR